MAIYENCPECGKRDGMIEMPFNVQGFCDEHRLIWELRRKTDGRPIPDDQKRHEWKVNGPRKYHRIGGHAPTVAVLPAVRRITGPIKDPSQPEIVIDEEKGIAYQVDRTRSIPYGINYFTAYAKRAGTDIARKLNAARTSLTEQYCTRLLDVGVGSGEFIESSQLPCLGFDINRFAIEMLQERRVFCDPYADGIPEDVDGVTLWDVLEHLPDPDRLLALIPPGCHLFVSMPIFADLARLYESKHFKPDEHYWYFTREGLIDWMAERGFQCLAHNDNETKAGRTSIETFVFRRRAGGKKIAAPKMVYASKEDQEADERVTTPDDLGGPYKCFQFVLPAGIGDIAWCYAKARHLPAMTGMPVIFYSADDSPRRAGAFIRMLPDVHWGGYLDGVNSWECVSQCLPPRWPAKSRTWEFLHRPTIQRLSLNLFLEAEGKLADFWPWCPTDYHFPLKLTTDDHHRAEKFCEGTTGTRFLIYVSNREKDDCRTDGWAMFKAEQWVELLARVNEHPLLQGKTSFHFVGAEFDRDKTELVADACRDAGLVVHECIGQPLAVALSLAKFCHYSFCYPSGIGVLMNVLRVPGIMLLPWCLEKLAESFADPKDLAERWFKCLVSPTVDEVYDWFTRYGMPQAMAPVFEGRR